MEHFRCQYLALSDGDTVNKVSQVSVVEKLGSKDTSEAVEGLQNMLGSLSAVQLRQMDLSFSREVGLAHTLDLDTAKIRSRDIRFLSTVDLDDAVIGHRLANLLGGQVLSHTGLTSFCRSTLNK